MSSSDASSDEATVSKVTKDSDSDDKEQAKKSRSPDSDVSEDEQQQQAQSKKKKLTKRKRKASGSSDDDDVDSSLFTDKEDKARWKALSELEKEREIFERMEARESLRAREEIEQQLAKKAKKGEKRRKLGGSDVKGSDSDSDQNPEFHRPSEIHRKHKEKNAMDALKSKRKEIEKKNAKNAALSIDAVFGANSGSSSSSSSSESSRSSSSSRDSSPDRAAAELKIAKKEVDTMRELSKARLSRHKLSMMIHAPFFNSTVVGCYVRLGQGQMSGSESRYKIWKIVDVEETNKVYDLEGKRTNKSIKCQFGRQERLFRMQFVSNAVFEQVEFEEWLLATKSNGSVPTIDYIEKKEADIKKAVDHKYSNRDIDLMIQEKSRFQKVPRNFAMTKAALGKQKELAKQAGDLREAERIQKEIDEIERHADELDKQRTKGISSIAFINHRNRTQIKDQVLSGKLKIEENSQDDPFTRKKGGMRIVSGSKSKLEGGASASSSSTNMIDGPAGSGGDSTSSTGSSSIAKPTLPPPSTLVTSSSTTSSFSAAHRGLKKKISDDLADLHDFDLEIDLGKLKEVVAPEPAAPPKRAPVSSAKGMSLSEYRMRRTGGSDASGLLLGVTSSDVPSTSEFREPLPTFDV